MISLYFIYIPVFNVSLESDGHRRVKLPAIHASYYTVPCAPEARLSAVDWTKHSRRNRALLSGMACQAGDGHLRLRRRVWLHRGFLEFKW